MSEDTRKILKELEVGTTYSGVDVICRQYKEIERLKSRLEEYQEYVEINHKEIERLNNKNEELLTLYTSEREVKDYYKNIINKLEEYTQDLLENGTWSKCGAHKILNKLQELKGSDKE